MRGGPLPLDRTPQVPRYREAYPYLAIGPACTAFDRGHVICDFKDRFDESLGLARFNLRADRCQIEYNVRTPSHGYVNHWETFDLSPISNGIEKRRPTIRCPGCDIGKKILFLKERWRCAPCHELYFRSQLVHPLARKWEAFDALNAQLAFGKPHGLHNTTYIRLLNKLEERRAALDGETRRYASCEFSDIIQTSWRSMSQSDTNFFPDYVIDTKPERGGSPVTVVARDAIRPLLDGPGLHEQVGHGDFETDYPSQI